MRSCWWPLANIQVDTLNSRLASRILLYIFISIKRLKYAPLKFCAVRNVCAPHTQRKRHLKRSNCICSGYHEQSHKMNKKCQSIWCDWEENKYRDFRSKWFMFVLLLSHSLPYSFSQTIITLIQSFQFVMFTHFFAPHCIALLCTITCAVAWLEHYFLFVRLMLKSMFIHAHAHAVRFY